MHAYTHLGARQVLKLRLSNKQPSKQYKYYCVWSREAARHSLQTEMALSRRYGEG